MVIEFQVVTGYLPTYEAKAQGGQGSASGHVLKPSGSCDIARLNVPTLVSIYQYPTALIFSVKLNISACI